MEIERASIADVLIIRPVRHGDHRGFFSETFRAAALAEAGVDCAWVQENHSYSAASGVVRGLHFQRAPKVQAKLLRVIRGAIYDVAVDIRRASPTYGKHAAVELSAENWAQIYVPAGFAHGFCTLTPDTEVVYKVSAEYGPAEEGGVLWNDPDLAIAWPVAESAATLSDRDRQWPRFRDFASPF
jgi:dTDP-4-dehydrorhamnose 3,5-epimerase